MAGLIVAAVIVVFALIVAARTIRIIPQARAGVVERLGRYSRTLTPGLTIVVPFIDKVKRVIANGRLFDIDQLLGARSTSVTR